MIDKAEVAIIETDISRILDGREGLADFYVAIGLLRNYCLLSDAELRRMVESHDAILEGLQVGQRACKRLRSLASQGMLSK